MFLLFRHMRSDSELKAEIHQSRVCIMASAPRALNLVITENNFKPIKHETHHGRTVKVLIKKGNILIISKWLFTRTAHVQSETTIYEIGNQTKTKSWIIIITLVLFWFYSTGLYTNEIIVCLSILLRQANLSAFQNTNTYYLVQMSANICVKYPSHLIFCKCIHACNHYSIFHF